MVARTEASLRSWRAAGVRRVAAVEEGREAAADFCRGEEKGGRRVCGTVQQVGGGTATHWRRKSRREKERGEGGRRMTARF